MLTISPLWYLVKNTFHLSSTGLVLYFSEMCFVAFLLVDVIVPEYLSSGWVFFGQISTLQLAIFDDFFFTSFKKFCCPEHTNLKKNHL